ncbi:MAG: TraR/DksA family transcriptional regulator [Steroidobacteraceae bacterium]|nr:TraR/DksA family transcriptional regulator [Steroidobacteraceae bacterium]
MHMPAEMNEIRARLLARRAELVRVRERLAAERRRDTEPLSADASDRALQCANDDVIDSIADTVLDELLRIDKALSRLDAGRYGLCEICLYPIESKRLAAVPYATCCAQCGSETGERIAG